VVFVRISPAWQMQAATRRAGSDWPARAFQQGVAVSATAEGAKFQEAGHSRFVGVELFSRCETVVEQEDSFGYSAGIHRGVRHE
jgi:hypothetical protein